MEYAIQKKILNARMKLFKKSEGLSFFGTCAYKYDWAVHNMEGQNAEGYVLFDKQTNQVEDGTIHINEMLVMRNDYTHVHLAYIICHELLHILSKHGVRKGQRNHDVWCIACDHVVERNLKLHAKVIQPYDGNYHMFPKLDKKEPTCTVERAYEWIVEQIELGNIKVILVPSDSGDMIAVTSDGKTFYVNSQVGGVDNKKIKGESHQVIQLTEKIVSEARALHQTMKVKGTQAGSLSTLLDEILAVIIPWERLLLKAIKTNVILKPDERTWKNPNKFFRPHGILLPGVGTSEDKEGTGIVIYTTDSSGSMSDTDLKKCSSVTEQSFQYFKEVHLYVHDIDVQQTKIFDKFERQQFLSFLKKEGYKGRGGTSHREVFKRIQKDFWEVKNGNKEDLSLVICLTDGYSDIENVMNSKKIEWIRIVPIIFIIAGKYKLNLEGHKNVTTIYIEDNK